MQRCASHAGIGRKAKHDEGEAPAMVRLQELAGNCACQRLVQDKNPGQQALLTTLTRQSVGRALTVLRFAEEEPRPDQGSGEEGCGLLVRGSEEKTEEEEAQTLTRSAEKSPVKVEEYGAEGKGSATVLCDGKGGYRVDLGMYGNMPCGIRDCTNKHEHSHIDDLKPHDACKDIANGELPEVPNPDQFRRASECKASRDVEMPCLTRKARAREPGCAPVLDPMKKKVCNDIENWCGERPRKPTCPDRE